MYKGILLVGLLAILGGGCAMEEPPYIEVEVKESVFEDKFYYEQLDSDEQEIYQELYQGVLLQEKKIYTHSEDADEANEILLSVMCDFPELFWIDGSATASTHSGTEIKGSYTVVEPGYLYTKKEIAKMQEEIDAVATEILSGVPKDSGEYEKIKYIYECLIEMAEYKGDAKHSQNMYSALVNRETVCAGYAKSNQYLLNKLGIFCTYVMGTAVENGKSDNHAWNIVRCNDKYYYVDITWADPVVPEEQSEKMSAIIYDYLCCSDDVLAETHTSESGYEYPACTSNDLNYYRMNGLYYETADRNQLIEAAHKSIDNKEETTVYKFASKELYEEAKAIMQKDVLNSSAKYLCGKYGLSQVEYLYYDDEMMQKIVVYWSYE